MSLLTDFLKLFKWDTTSETDLDEEFDIDTSMNGNWDILDTKAKNHEDRINTLEDVQAEQDSLIQKLKDNMINLQTEEATSLYVTDAGTLPASLKVRGNHKQDGTPTLENPIEIETVKNEVNVVVSNKNLYKITISDNNYNGIKLTVNKEKGYLSATGTSTGYSHPIGTVILKPGDYVFSGGPQNGDWNKQRLSIYVKNSEGTFENVTTIYKDTTYSVHLDEETEYRLNYVIPSSITVTDEKIYPQVEKGTVATDFIKHEEIKKTLDIQQEMLKGDDFDLENSKEVHNWKKKIFDGTESWTQSSVASSVFYVDLDITKVSSKLDLVSDQYAFGGLISDTAQCENNKTYAYKVSEISNSARIYVRNDNFTTLESFKNALSEKNMTLYYIAATQTQLDLTETQKQQLTQLDNLDLFKGINNIYTEEGIALMQLDYSADTKMYIDNLVTQNTAESEG